MQMPKKGKKVFVALSGGVDSSTTAALLVKRGYECAAVFIITSDEASRPRMDAEKVAKELCIELHVLDLRSDFEQILDYFCSEYKRGRTPNPCVVCNRQIKFGKLWDFARSHGAEMLATGHYARIVERDGEVGLYEGSIGAKDQSYVLAMIDRNVLPHLLLPMGDYSKDRTRELAVELGLSSARRQESQEICFIPNGDWVGVLEQRHPELVRKGDIINSDGRVLGEHNGVHRFTIGQRRGLRVAMGKPYYVVNIDAGSNTVTLGPREEVMHRKLRTSGANWLTGEPESSFRAKVKVRYNDRGAPATVFPDADKAVVEFDEPKSAITPGQLAVFYVEDGGGCRVAGGGWIDEVGH